MDRVAVLRQQKKKEMANIIEQAASSAFRWWIESHGDLTGAIAVHVASLALCEANAAYEARDSAQAQMARWPEDLDGFSFFQGQFLEVLEVLEARQP